MTLEERIEKKIEEKLAESKEKKKKEFRLPRGKKVSTGKKKNNYVTLMKINENGQIKFDTVQITDQTLMENKIPRLAANKYVLYYKKNPIIILPSWRVEPFNPTKDFEESLTDGSNTKGYAILLERMQKEQLGVKKPMGNIVKVIIGLVIAAIIGYAFISGSV